MANLNDSQTETNAAQAPGGIQQAPPASLSARPLPTLEQLYADDGGLMEKHNALNVLLNQPPNPKWLVKHNFITLERNGQHVPYMYLPIQRVEWLLTNIFIKWRSEILQVQQLANAVVVTIRLYYRDPVTLEYDWQDGVGAADIQTKKGASAADFAQIVPAAIMKAAPAAESYAIKDAAEKIGRIFGKDLNRADEVNYSPLADKKFTNAPLND